MEAFIYFLKFSIKSNKKYPFMVFLKVAGSYLMNLAIIIYPKYIIDALLSQNIRSAAYFAGVYITINYIGNTVLEILKGSINKEKNIVYNRFQLWIADLQAEANFDYLEKDSTRNLYEKASKYIFGFQGSQGFGIAFENLCDLIGQVFMIVSIIVILAKLNIILMILVIVIILLNTLFKNIVNKKTYRTNMERVPFERKENYFKALFMDYKYAKEIRLNDIKSFLLERYQNSLDKTNSFYQVNINRYISLSIFSLSLNLIQDIMTYSVLIRNVMNSTITVGSFSMYLNAVTKFSSSFYLIMHHLLSVKEYSMYFDSFKEYVNLVNSNKIKGNIELDLNETDFKIEFRNVYFSYDGSENYVLKNVSLYINTLEQISIVGENGAGKTTLIKLLTRLYVPTKGMILLNNINIQLICYDDYIKALSVVFQDYKLFPFSIKENILFEDKNNLSDNLDYYLNLCNLNSLVSKMNFGVNTQMSREFSEDGVELSGGEAQKICLCRAISRKPKLIILDEPSSALDPNAEFQLYKSFQNIIFDKTAVFISHRLGIARLCDRIYVLENGIIVENGSHQELIDKKGVYYEMFQNQSSYYN